MIKNAKLASTASLTLLTEAKSPMPQWNQFAKANAKWLVGFPEDEPIYRLPRAAIEALSIGNPLAIGTRRKAFLKDFADSETEFTSFCEEHGAVGVWFGQLVRYDPLTPPAQPAVLAASFGNKIPWLNSEGARVVTEEAEEARRRLLGVPGWLLTEPSFLKAVSDLKQIWKDLPAGERPVFPLSRSVPIPRRLPGSVQGSSERGAFQSQYEEFLDRWGLTQMATWDLPHPQGPLMPSPVTADSAAYPRHGIHIVLPVHYPVQANDELIRKILEYQRQVARKLEIDPSFAGLPHSGSYGRMFEIIHLEGAIRSRVRPGNSLHGHGLAMENAFSKSLHISVASVKKHRLAISACRKGRRASVRWLRPVDPKPRGRRKARRSAR
jgi:hypothetical protein